ncbi:hypothetical protein, partial [Shewanella algae]|uniref:hypothetical protein n=1 Tax=Shewanella algae TaxID=38313 RepID=UPI00313C292A
MARTFRQSNCQCKRNRHQQSSSLRYSREVLDNRSKSDAEHICDGDKNDGRDGDDCGGLVEAGGTILPSGQPKRV